MKKIYEEAKTPYQRVLESADVAEQAKRVLVEKYEQLNPAELHRKIERLQEKLYSLASPVRGVKHEI